MKTYCYTRLLNREAAFRDALLHLNSGESVWLTKLQDLVNCVRRVRAARVLLGQQRDFFPHNPSIFRHELARLGASLYFVDDVLAKQQAGVVDLARDCLSRPTPYEFDHFRKSFQTDVKRRKKDHPHYYDRNRPANEHVTSMKEQRQQKKTLAQIAQHLNEQGKRTPSGKLYTAQNVGYYLTQHSR
jgi:hypothetical protein